MENLRKSAALECGNAFERDPEVTESKIFPLASTMMAPEETYQ